MNRIKIRISNLNVHTPLLLLTWMIVDFLATYKRKWTRHTIFVSRIL